MIKYLYQNLLNIIITLFFFIYSLLFNFNYLLFSLLVIYISLYNIYHFSQTLETDYMIKTFNSLNDYNRVDIKVSNVILFFDELEILLSELLNNFNKLGLLINKNDKSIKDYRELGLTKKDLINMIIINDNQAKWKDKIRNNQWFNSLYFTTKNETNSNIITIYFNHVFIDGLDIFFLQKRIFNYKKNNFIIDSIKAKNYYFPILSESLSLFLIPELYKIIDRPSLVNKNRLNFNDFIVCNINKKKKNANRFSISFSTYLILEYVYVYFNSLEPNHDETIYLESQKSFIIAFPYNEKIVNNLNTYNSNIYNLVIFEIKINDLKKSFNEYMRSFDTNIFKFKILQCIGLKAYSNLLNLINDDVINKYKKVRTKIDLNISIIPISNNKIRSENNDNLILSDINKRFMYPTEPLCKVGYTAIITYDQKIQYTFNLKQNYSLINKNRFFQLLSNI